MSKWGKISRYIRRPLVIYDHSEFPYKWGNFDFLFYQCMNAKKEGTPCSQSRDANNGRDNNKGVETQGTEGMSTTAGNNNVNTNNSMNAKTSGTIIDNRKCLALVRTNTEPIYLKNRKIHFVAMSL
jgi:hypothetical protein